MVNNQENLLSFQRYTEEDVIFWMANEKRATEEPVYLWYKSQFGDCPTHTLVRMRHMRLIDGIPTIYCYDRNGIQLWGYLSQFSIVNITLYKDYRGEMFF